MIHLNKASLITLTFVASTTSSLAFGNFWEEVKKTAGSVVQPIVPVVTVVVETAKVVEKGAKEVGNAVNNVGKEAENAVNNVGKEAENAVNNAGTELGNAGEVVVEGAGKITQEIGDFTLRTITDSVGTTVKTLETTNGYTISTMQTVGGNTVHTFVKAGNDLSTTYTKAWKDTEEQTKKSFQDAVDAGTAIGNYTANQVKSYEQTLKNADKRLREGKIIDSMWGLGVEPLQSTEANFAKATQESKLIAQAAATAAATYGGPGGAAAYAAWATYKATGNADLALRAGLLAAATTQTGSSIGNMPTGTAGEALKKIAMAGAAGGIAVAAAGGDEQAIKDGFLKSAGAVLVQAGTDKIKAYSPDAENAWETVQCVSARDVDCLSKTTWVRDAKGKILYDEQGNPRIDTTLLDPKQYIGKWTGIDPVSLEGQKDAFIASISELPKMPAIPLMNNTWVLTWQINKSQDVAHGQPTAVLTYVGTNPPFISEVKYEQNAIPPSWAVK